jgi:hypothetical protein
MISQINISEIRAQTEIFSISGQIVHIQEAKIPEKIEVTLVSINENGTTKNISTIANNGYFIFFLRETNDSVFFLETTYQNIRYVSDYYNKDKIQETNVKIKIYDTSMKIPKIENIVSKFTLSKIDYLSKELTFIREDIINNESNWTFTFNDSVQPTYIMNLLDQTASARGNLGTGSFYETNDTLNIVMPIRPGLNTISTIHTVKINEKNEYNFNFNSQYDTNILEIMIPERFANNFIYSSEISNKGKTFLKNESLIVLQAVNIPSNSTINLKINNLFLDKNFFLIKNEIFTVTLVLLSVIMIIGVILTITKKKTVPFDQGR